VECEVSFPDAPDRHYHPVLELHIAMSIFGHVTEAKVLFHDALHQLLVLDKLRDVSIAYTSGDDMVSLHGYNSTIPKSWFKLPEFEGIHLGQCRSET